MIRKVLKVSAVALFALFAGAQFVRPERLNEPPDPSRSLEARTQLTPEVRALLARSCDDCHTQRTRWPWYSQVAPVSWFVADHVRHARTHLDFSDWASYESQDIDGLLHGICGEAKRGTMPLPSYTLVHRDARLSPADIQTLCDWTTAERQRRAKR
jgi:Haem-binding domain